MVGLNEHKTRWLMLAVIFCTGVLLSMPTVSNTAMANSLESELTDDFDGGVWKECLWTAYRRLGGQTTYFEDWEGDEGNFIRVQDGMLTLEVPANTFAGMSWELGLESKFILAGDFEAQVDYQIDVGSYWTSLDMRGVNMMFVELMAGDQGTRRRHVRSTGLADQDDADTSAAHLWLSNPDHDTVTQINTDTQEFLRTISVGQRPNRTAVDLLGNMYVFNRGRGYTSGDGTGGSSDRRTTVTFIKASACPDPDCDLSNEPDHIYTLDFTGGDFGPPIYNGRWGGGLAVDRNNDVWVGFRETPMIYHLEYHPSDTPGGDEWSVKEVYDISSATFGDATRTYGMAFARDGSLWIATRDSSTQDGFVRIDPLTGQKQKFYQPPRSCMSPYGIAIDADQRLYRSTLSTSTDCRSYRFDPSEPDPASQWTEMQTVASQTQGARGLAADAQGRVWVASDSNNRLTAWDQETGDVVLSTPTCTAPVGVALDRNNLLWVSCFNSGLTDQVRYYNMNGDYLGRIESDVEITYTYSDMTGYQLRQFGVEDWQESFTVSQDDSAGEYYVSTVENNYGGGLEYGGGGASAIDPSQAPLELHPDLAAATNGPEVHRMRVSSRYHTDRVPRIVSHPLRLENIWGFRTPAEADLDEIPFQFTVTEDSFVYVAFDNMANPVPNWLRAAEGWTGTNETVESSDPSRDFALFRKSFDAGEEVILGNANGYSGNPPQAGPFENYFVYVYPKALDSQPTPSPEAIIDDSGAASVALTGTLRIAREGSEWTFSYLDGNATGWRTMTRESGPVSNVPMRLRTRLDPFWHSGPSGNQGGAILVRYGNFAVNSVDGVPGGPYCREGCDETVPGYGASCLGGDYGLCPGVFDCVNDELTCVVETRTERCNGLDDDCDGWVDHDASGLDFPTAEVSHDGNFHYVDDFGMPGDHPEGGGVEVYEGNDCPTSLQGPCAQGYWECVGGAMQCQPFQLPQPEQCDGLDNSCDGQANHDVNDPISLLGYYVQARQRSLPNTPLRPVMSQEGQSFEDWAGYDGFNVDPQDPGVIAEGKARVVIYVRETTPGNYSYMLWLTHGEAVPTQGAVTASYFFEYTQPLKAEDDALFEDGIVTNNLVRANDRSQYIVVESGEGQTGGVGIGPFEANATWSITLSAHFFGDVDEWQLYNAVTGESHWITTNENLVLSNNNLDGFYGPMTADAGGFCVPTYPDGTEYLGICARGTQRCVENGDDWQLECLPGVTPQLEVCDGRDNRCNGVIDGPDEDLHIPVVELNLGGNVWTEYSTVDTQGSAVEFMNFQQRSPTQPGVGSVDIRDVVDPSRSIQAPRRSVVAVHRDGRPGNNTLSLVLAHGQQMQGADGDVPPAGYIDMTMNHSEARESFPTWHVDVVDQEDNGVITPYDEMPYDSNANQYFMLWNLHRWTDGGTTHREADGGVIADLFAENLNGDLNEISLRISSSQEFNEWRFYSPYYEDDGLVPLDMGSTLRMRVVPRTIGDAHCVIQENEIESCLGNEDIYTCQDGQVICGLGTQGCCSPEHPMYDEPCGLDDESFIHTGACRAAMRCDANGAWACLQVQAPEPEVCDGQDNTCDGIVDGFLSGFEDADGTVHNCPAGRTSCGPQECSYMQSCVCSLSGQTTNGRECVCRADLEDFLSAPDERICDWHERLEDDECVPVASVPPGN